MSSYHNLPVAVCLTMLIAPPIGWCQVDVSNGNSVPGHELSRSVQAVSHQTVEQSSRLPIRTERPRLLSAPNAGNSLVRTITSLGVVAGLMLGFIWWTRRHSSDGSTGLPSNLVDVVGCVPLDAKHKAHIVRFGDRILLLSLDGAGVSKLGEISAADFDREANASLRNGGHASPVLNRRGALHE